MGDLPASNQVYLGDALATLRTWPDSFVDCCVTSPPYFALRSYLPADHPGKAQEMGSEGSIAEFIESLIAVLREVRRVLKPSGVCWVNIADSYAGSGKGRNGDGSFNDKSGAKQVTNLGSTLGTLADATDQPPAKNRMLIPERFILAAQLDGWIVRDDVIWAKGREYADDDVGLNPMPGSQKDRCTSAYEHIYMLTKQARGYYFDWQAIAEPPRESSMKRLGQDVDAQTGSERANGGAKTNGNMKALKPAVFGGINKHRGLAEQGNRLHSGKEWDPYHGSRFDTGKTATHQLGRAQEGDRERHALVMPRNVWIFPTRGYKGSHYATFPPELPRRCIAVSCPATVCAVCGKPWVRVVERVEMEPESYHGSHFTTGKTGVTQLGRSQPGPRTTLTAGGFTPTCGCNAATQPGLCLDPFMGSGTTAAVAEQLGRRWLGIDLDERNLPLIEERLAAVRPDTPLFSTS